MTQNPVYEQTGSIFDPPVEVEQTEGQVSPDDLKIDQWNVGKIQVVEYPMALPSRCACCGAVPNPDFAQRRYFVDFGLSLEFYGQVYFCTDCFVAAAKILGYSSPRDTTRLAEELDDTKADNVRIRSENESIRSGLTAISDINIILRNPGGDRPTDKIPDKPDKGITETEPGIDSPVDEQGTDDIPSTTGNDRSPRNDRRLSLDE